MDSVVTSIADTLQTIQADSIITQQVKSDLDTVVYSSASDSLIFFVKDKKMSIHGDGKIEYQRMSITSANIIIDFDRNELLASGEQSDSTGEKMVNTPVLSEAGDSYEGQKISYNFKTGQGV
jgi:lipopolysaccharide export system protein LptA